MEGISKQDLPSPVAVVKTVHGRAAIHVAGSRTILRGSLRRSVILRRRGTGRTATSVAQVRRNVGALLSRLAVGAKVEARHINLIRHVD